MQTKFGFFMSLISGYGIYNPDDLKAANIVRWMVKPGDYVKREDPLVEIETDKVTTKLTSLLEGTIVSLNYAEGEEWLNGGVEDTPHGALVLPELGIIEIEADGKTDAPSQDEAPAETAEPDVPPSSAWVRMRITQQAKLAAKEHGVDIQEVMAWLPPDAEELTLRDVEQFVASRQEFGQKQKSSGLQVIPAARRMAKEHGVDLADIRGTGSDGMILVADIEKNIAQRTADKESPLLPPDTRQPPSEREDRTGENVSMLRRTMASLLEKGYRNIPKAGDGVTVDISKLVEFRAQLKALWEQKLGTPLRYDHFFAFTLVRLLASSDFGFMNAYWEENGPKIIRFARVNLGIAVHTERGLMVPVIHSADTMSFDTFVRAYEELVAATREGKAKIHDFRDATCIFNNTGVGGGNWPDPIIPYVIESDGNERPLTLLLATAKIEQHGAAYLMNVVAKFDHRVVDGMPAMDLLAAFKKTFESPENPIEFAVVFK